MREIDGSDNYCFKTYNNRPNLPTYLQDSTFKSISLPNKDNFGIADPIARSETVDSFYGEGLYLKNELQNADCSSIDHDGNYKNILGTFPNGEQAYYGAFTQLEENTVENPIADGGAAMAKVDITYHWTDEDEKAYCPNVSKSFLNSKYFNILFLLLKFYIMSHPRRYIWSNNNHIV